jgi:hypothetical protein
MKTRSILWLAAAAIVGCAEPSFDAERWRQGQGVFDDANPRREMLGDINRAGVDVGASREEVHRLLGAPDAIDAGAEVYFLGSAAYAPEAHQLVIRYDARGIVERLDVVYL